MGQLIANAHLVVTLLFVLASAVVSIRMLLLARRTHQKPELFLGLGILGTAVLGYGVLIAAALVRGVETMVASTAGARGLQATGQILHDAGVTMILAFVITVFRPGERWAKVLATGMLLSLWGASFAYELHNGFRNTGRGTGVWWLHSMVIWTYPLWMMIESYRYYAMMRRRLALGLADPLVTNRFFVWGSASLGTALATWASSIGYFLPQRVEVIVAWEPTIQILTAIFGVATVMLYYLTFFPPSSYRRWVIGAAPAPAVGGTH